MPQDPLQSLAAPDVFSDYLRPPTYQASQQKPSGFEGPVGAIAHYADSFLSGLSQGRANAYAKSEQKRSQSERSLAFALNAVQNSNLPDAMKQQQMAPLMEKMGLLLHNSIPDGKSKGKKGGDPANGGGEDQQHPGHHILSAMKGMLGNMLGPGAEKQTVDPQEIDKLTHQTFKSLADHENSVQAQVQKADQNVLDMYGAASKEAGGHLTREQLLQKPELMKAMGAAEAANNGQPTPVTAQLNALLSASDKERSEDAKNKVELEKERLKTELEDKKEAAQLALQDLKEKAANQRQDAKDAAAEKLNGPLRRAEIAERYARANLDQVKAKAAKGELASGAVTSDLIAKVESSPPDKNGNHPEALEGSAPGVATLVKMLTGYRFPANSYALRAGNRSKDPAFLQALELAPLYDPSFDAKEYVKRQKVMESFSSGKDAQNVTALNTAVRHLFTLRQKASALNNTSIPLWNTIKDRTASASGSGDLKAFSAAADAVYNEMASVFKGTGATNQEIKAWRDTIQYADSPEQFNKQFETFFDLMGGRIQALQSKYTAGMGKANPNGILSPSSRKILSQMGVDVSGVDPGTNIDTTPPPPGTRDTSTAPPPDKKASGGPPEGPNRNPPANTGNGAPQLPKPSQPGQHIDAETAKKYVMAAGGDPAKARALAQKDKWAF